MSDNERIAVAEARLDHVEEEMADMSTKVNEIHTVLMQAKGARWLILTVIGIAGLGSSLYSFLSSHWRP